MKVGNASLEEWKDWLENELEPPVKASPEVAYVLRAFLELVNRTLKSEEKDVTPK